MFNTSAALFKFSLSQTFNKINKKDKTTGISLMKNIISMSAIAVAVALGLSGCSTDDDEPVIEEVVNTAATFAGDVTGETTKDATDSISGSVTVTDPDADEATIVEQTDFVSDYGTFTILADGSWTYTVDTENTTVAGLADENASVDDTIIIASADGTTQQLVFTIFGVPADQIAKVTDTVDNDNGEIYYQLKESLEGDAVGLTTGKISFSILYDADETETAYISLYEAEGSTSTVIGELTLNEGKFGLRQNTFLEGTTPSKANKDTSTVDEDAIDAPDFTPGEWVDVELAWDTSSTTDIGTYTVMIDGTSYGPFDSQFPTPGVLVESISIRLSSKSAIAPDAIYVNDLKIYSDVEGTALIFEDDFEGYTVGDQLDGSNDSSPYGSRTFEAEVVVYGAETGTEEPGDSVNTEVFSSTAADVTPGTAGNKIVEIMDTTDGDAGELRFKLSSDNMIVKGRLEATFMKSAAAECTDGGNVKDAYIGVHGTPSSTYEAIVDLRIDGSDYDTDYAIRKNNVTGDKTVDISAPTFTADTWTDVEITWDATSADATTNPVVSVSIDGTAVADPWNSYSEALGGFTKGAQYFTFRLGDTSATMANCMFKVDNIKIYAIDDADAETMILGENFEDYADATDLKTVVLSDGTTLLYNSSTNEATVGVEE